MAKRKHDWAFELTSMGRKSYASHSAIANLLSHIDQHGMPSTFDRSAQYRARKEVSRNTVTPYGPLVHDVELPLISGGTQAVAFQNPLAFLYHNCLESPHYSLIVKDALLKHPPSADKPWRIIVYQDGVDPSDGLAKHHSRKSSVFYWSIAEFGYRALAYEEVWGTVSLTRASEILKISGGISCVFQHVLQQFFNNTFDIRLAGVSVEFKDGSKGHILARASILLADMPAIKECISCKGHSGVLCCPLCRNATLEKSQAEVPLHKLTNKAVSIADPEWDKFVKNTNEGIRKDVARVNELHDLFMAGNISKDEFDDRCTAIGWVYTPAFTILNPKFNLQLADTIMYDWAHIYVHDGLGDTELGICMRAYHSARTETTYAEIGEYMSGWTFPARAPNIKHLFTKSANTNNIRKSGFTCLGSEFLTIAPVLHRYFVKVVVPRGKLLEHALSMINVLVVIMMLTSIKTDSVDPDELQTAILKHFLLFLSCYGEGACKPKHHYAIHLPHMLRHFGMLLATFTHERKHRLVTRYTRDRKNMQNWDSSSLEEVTCHQLYELSQPFFMMCKTAKPRGNLMHVLRELFPGTSDDQFVLLNDITCNGGAAHAGDVVSCLNDGSLMLGELLVNVGIVASDKSVAYSLISVWQPDPAYNDTFSGKFIVSRENVVKVETKFIDTVFTYRKSEDGKSAVVLFPHEVRPK